MFTIEHGFDATTITLVDDAPDTALKEDVVIHMRDDRVTLQQWDAGADQIRQVTLSLHQVRDMFAALDLPEGVYQLEGS